MPHNAIKAKSGFNRVTEKLLADWQEYSIAASVCTYQAETCCRNSS